MPMAGALPDSNRNVFSARNMVIFVLRRIFSFTISDPDLEDEDAGLPELDTPSKMVS